MFKKENKEPKEVKEVKEVKDWLAVISSQLERLIICQEKRLSGEVLKDFNSKQHLTNGGE